MSINRFEDIKAWQEARVLAGLTHDTIKSSEAFARDLRFRDQVTSAAVSVMSNIAEGFSRRSTREFAQFLFVAKGSVAELQSQLYVALDQGYIDQPAFQKLYSQADQVARLTSGFITYLLTQDKPAQRKQPNKPNEPNELNKL
jgi:four helix bundle protein